METHNICEGGYRSARAAIFAPRVGVRAAAAGAAAMPRPDSAVAAGAFNYCWQVRPDKA